MAQISRPTNKQVREYMERRNHSDSAPKKPEDIRRELGWHMIQQKINGTTRR